jgi:cardiolipin synthase (CMP-forming)
MKRLPNIISVIRIICSLALLFTKVLSVEFFLLYLLCGISDVLDGYIARKTGSESQFGAVLDSIADVIFLGILMIILFPIIEWSLWMLCWIGGIATVRFISLGIGFIRYHKLAFLHTYANKATGLLIFFLPILYCILGLSFTMCLVCGLASISAVEELLIHMTSKKLDLDIKSVVK